MLVESVEVGCLLLLSFCLFGLLWWLVLVEGYVWESIVEELFLGNFCL